MKENLRKAQERMQSEHLIKMSQLYYDFREDGITSAQMSAFTGIPASRIAPKKGSMEKVYGFQFKRIGKHWYLTDITLVPDPSYLKNQEKLQAKRKKERAKNEALRKSRQLKVENEFTRAFALMGV